MRQKLPEIPAPAVPYGQDSPKNLEARACSQREFLKRAPAAHPPDSRGRGTLCRIVTPPFGNTSPTTKTAWQDGQSTAANTCAAVRLNRNNLGGGFRVARTSRPRDPIALASFRFGFYLRVSYLLSRSVRIPASRDKRLRYL